MKTDREVKEYILNSFNFDDIKVDEKALQLGGVRDYIVRILTKSKLRIGPASDGLKEMLEKKVEDSIEQNAPITLIPATGGFKNSRCISAPHIDLAELMQLQFLLSSVIEISKAYEPGLIIEYTLDAEAMCIVDNYKPEWIETYVKEFKNMLGEVGKILPANVSLRCTSFTDFYKLGDMKKNIEDKLEEVKEEENYETLIQERIAHARNDYVFDGWEDYSKLSKKGREELLRESVWRHKLWLTIDYENRADYIEGGLHIPIAHRSFPGCLAIKSYKGTDMQFWVSNGILDLANENIRFRLESPKKVGDLETLQLDGIFGVNNLNVQR